MTLQCGESANSCSRRMWPWKSAWRLIVSQLRYCSSSKLCRYRCIDIGAPDLIAHLAPAGSRREKPYGNLDDLHGFTRVLFVPPCQSDPPPSPTNCYPSWSIGVPALTLLTHVHNALLSGPHQSHYDCARVLMGPIAHTNPKPISILTIRAPTLSPLPHPSPTSLFRTCGNMIFFHLLAEPEP